MKPLASQALDRVGKGWGVASGTREARLGAIKSFAKFVQSQFGLERINNLKPRHVEAFAQSLHDRGLSPRTGANYMAHVRHLCEAIGKPGICARDNEHYGFNVESRNNPLTMDVEKVAEIRSRLETLAERGNRIAKMMIAAAAMRAAFGLRHKEALMSSRVVMVNGKPHLEVKGAKGGRPRMIEVRTPEQQAALALVQATAKELGNGNGRVIPPERTLESALKAESKLWHRLGGTKEALANMHAARHAYAQAGEARGDSPARTSNELGHGDDRPLSAYR